MGKYWRAEMSQTLYINNKQQVNDTPYQAVQYVPISRRVM